MSAEISSSVANVSTQSWTVVKRDVCRRIEAIERDSGEPRAAIVDSLLRKALQMPKASPDKDRVIERSVYNTTINHGDVKILNNSFNNWFSNIRLRLFIGGELQNGLTQLSIGIGVGLLVAAVLFISISVASAIFLN